MDHGFGDHDSWSGPEDPPRREDATLPPQAQGEIEEKWTRAQVLAWKRKAEAYDVLVECCERLSAHQDDGSPLVEALLDAVIEAKRLREFGAGSPQPQKSKAEEKSGGGG